MKKTLALEFEKALRLLTAHIPTSDGSSRKPILFHSIRVGIYLYENGYSRDIVLAGVLHDAIEWSTISEKTIADEFGDAVAKLVLASTKDDSIADKEEKTTELIKRCIQNGHDALVVKAADILDSIQWYSGQGNNYELHHCMRNIEAIIKYKPKNFVDKIFDELKKWRNRSAHLTK